MNDVDGKGGGSRCDMLPKIEIETVCRLKRNRLKIKVCRLKRNGGSIIISVLLLPMRDECVFD